MSSEETASDDGEVVFLKIINKLAEAANRILMFGILLFAAAAIGYGVYVLCDILYIKNNAFVSHDLLQYRPAVNVSEEEGGRPESFTQLKYINPDTVGWVEIFGTHINYPVVQGKNDLEYLNKDIYGNSTLSGSIYLASANSGDFGDWYSLLYGHHMENGAMFGDITKYLNKDYFDSHRTGVLQTENGEFLIDIFACVSTNSYEDTIYNVSEGAEEKYPELREYISSHSDNSADIPEDVENRKILAFSTCTDATTNGRIVLFAEATKVEAGQTVVIPIYAVEEEKEPVLKKLTATIGDISYGSQWAFLNLVCVVYTIITLFPILSLNRKYRQIRYSKKKYREIEKEENIDDVKKKIYNDLKGFVRKMHFGMLLEALIVVASVIVFVLTENINGKIIISDEWTWLMVVMSASSLLADFICFRYRGIRPENDEKTG